MKQTEITIPAEFVSGLHINGMRGRVLSLPAKKKVYRQKTLLLVYGHHSSIERMYSLAAHLSEYSNVVMPDLPGFGGMDSFYVIGKKPSIDNMADYLATFIKMTFKNKPIMICGMSYGFIVVTKMLQKYPDLQKQVTLLVSLVGFSHKDDFKFSPLTYHAFTSGSRIFSTLPASLVAKHIFFTKPVITAMYSLSASRHVKMKDADKEERKRRINFEVYLWRCNDARTYFATSYSFLTVDQTKQTVPLPLHHVGVNHDQYFTAATVNKNLRKIYSSVKVHRASLPNHAPTVVSQEAEAGALIPGALKRLLRQSKV